jgi:hypothetical protein
MARSQAHLLPTYAYGGIPLPLVVRSYLRRKKLLRRTGRWPTLSSGALRSASTGSRPHLQGNRISMWGRSHTRGRQSCPPPLFQLPLAGGRRSRRGMRPSPFCYPSDDSLFSLSLSSRAYVSSLEVCLTSRPTTSAGGLTSRGSPWPPPRPCARLRAQ